MGKLDGLKGAFDKASGAIKETTSKVGEKAKEADVEKIRKTTVNALNSAKDVANNLQDQIKNFDAEKAKEAAINAADSGLKAMKKHFVDKAETDKTAKEILKNNIETNDKLSIEDSLKIVYILMLADQKADELEKETMRNIKNEVDIENSVDEAAIINYCDSLIEKSRGEEYLDYLIDEISNIIINSKNTKNGSISRKYLLWNLLVIAYSDGEYSKEEKEIIRVVTRRLEINKDVIQEMELAIQTIMSINEEKNILDGNQFDEKELKERVNTIMESVHELIGE